MNTVERRERDDKIEELYRAGLTPNTIGVRFGLHGHRIRVILAERGYEFFHPNMDTPHVDRNDTVWTRSESDRRMAFWKKARTGAAAALRSFGKVTA